MASANDYQKQANDVLRQLPETVRNGAEAKVALPQVRHAQKELRHIKKKINLEIKGIRSAYSAQKPGAGGAGFLRLLGKRKAAGQWSADMKRATNQQRDKEIAPYESVKFMIDEAITQLDGRKPPMEQMYVRLSTELA